MPLGWFINIIPTSSELAHNLVLLGLLCRLGTGASFAFNHFLTTVWVLLWLSSRFLQLSCSAAAAAAIPHL